MKSQQNEIELVTSLAPLPEPVDATLLEFGLSLAEAKVGSNVSEASPEDIQLLVSEVVEGQRALCEGISETNTLQVRSIMHCRSGIRELQCIKCF